MITMYLMSSHSDGSNVSVREGGAEGGADARGTAPCDGGAQATGDQTERSAEVASAAIAAMRENMLLRLKPPVVQPSAGAGTVVAMPSRVLLAVRATDRRNITELFMAWHIYIQKRVEETQVSRPQAAQPPTPARAPRPRRLAWIQRGGTVRGVSVSWTSASFPR